MKLFIRQICPPIIWNGLSSLKRRNNSHPHKVQKKNSFNPDKQDLDLYWDPQYAQVLEEWGRDNVWNEIQLLLAFRSGKVLDIACGTGITIKFLEKFPSLELHGFDISDLLINKAIEKNISQERLKVADATKTNYSNDEFDFSYSIGSLEHFTTEGIDKFLNECSRYTKTASFHMIPISRSGENEGWMKTVQSFHNNSEQWWNEKFIKNFKYVFSVPSKWEDEISVGRWFLCSK